MSHASRALVLGAMLLAAGCTTTLELGERRYREGDRLAALETWREIPPDSLQYDAARRRIAEVEDEFAQLVVRYEQRARYFERKGRLGESILNWRLAQKLSPGDAEAAVRVQELSRTLAERKTEKRAGFERAFAARDFPAARDQLAQLRTLDPFDPALANDESRFEEALRGEVDRLLAQGREAYGARRYGDASAAFRRVLAIEPENESAQGYLSFSQSARAGGRPDRADAMPEPAAASPPSTRPATATAPAAPPGAASESQIRAEGFHQNALAAERRGDAYAAIRQDLRALQADPRHAGARRHLTALRQQLQPEVEGLIESGRSAFRQEDLQGALDQWRRALLVDPDNDRAQQYVARAEKLLDNLEQLRADPDASRGAP